MPEIASGSDWGERYIVAPDIVLTAVAPKRNWALAVESGRIVACADRDDVQMAYRDWPVVKLPSQAVVPGFVESHVHLGQGFAKALTFGEPSQIWQRIWLPLELSLTPELAYTCAKWMFLEGLRGGFTTFCNFALLAADRIEGIHKAAIETGVRLVSCAGTTDIADYTVVTDIKPEIALVDLALKRAEVHLEQCKVDRRISPSLCASDVQSASAEMIRIIADFCRDHDVVFQIHADSHFPEVHSCILKSGRRPIQLIADNGGLGPHTLIHHAAVISEPEIRLLQSSRAAITYNPVASQWKLDGIAPAFQLKERGIRFGLGNDSARMDAFRMMDAAEASQRLLHGMRVMDFSCGAGWTWLDAATSGGADVCGLGKVTGKLEAGLRADFLVLDLDAPEVQPSWDFEWELVRYFNRDQINCVVIDGTVVMRHGRPVSWDMDEFLRDSRPKAEKVVRECGIVRLHPTATEARSKWTN